MPDMMFIFIFEEVFDDGEDILGKPVYMKVDEFPENFRREGGGHFRSKKFHCNFFCIRNGNFGHEFPEKNSKRGRGSFPI